MNKQKTNHRFGLILILIALAFAGSRFIGTRAFAQAGAWAYTGNLQVARMSSLVVRLKDGRVLVAGTSGELYDPVSGTWSNTAPMIEVSYSPAATLLNDGTVLVVGGTDASSQSAVAQVFEP